MNFAVESSWASLVDIILPSGQQLQLPVPVCEACQQHLRGRQHKGGIRGMQAGSLLAGGLVVVSALVGGWDGSLLLVAGLAALAVGVIGGFILGTLLSHRPPAKLKCYSPSRGTLALRFRHPEYAGRVLAAIRAQAGSGEHR
jgi:hypothetical protein